MRMNAITKTSVLDGMKRVNVAQCLAVSDWEKRELARQSVETTRVLSAQRDENARRFEIVSGLAKEQSAKLDAMPDRILEIVTDEYGEPCNGGFARAMDALGLDMPKRELEVTVRWSEAVTYEATETVSCEWDGGEYRPTDDALESLRDSAREWPEYEYEYHSEEIVTVGGGN